ncbi:hypothetical protein PPL_01339 [Heterostelium album PN500]|uniref:F-box domain-containing protein n=1 Tax=Heterostelium pallidum (strain ATCC 26659 / Pp 5 / PN500) TaxID=670386 RepID=D3AYS5_HETP5|nr:hypothetical protein PPL_01339 [Heterostelium album PN500]EFA86102.1 hypothetical protein PPL_01339 [Heterostelium album PN500]|eukprot:XP_020438208.1 hypothetical protein PPL_01339 [Heterostelium album PN500]
MLNIDNNTKHIFVNLPFILLSKILKELDDDLDIICFSLVCKRWFDHRNSYLSFNCDYFNKSSKDKLQQQLIDNSKFFKLKSYVDIFQSSLDHLPNCLITLPKNDYPFSFPSKTMYTIYNHQHLESVKQHKSVRLLCDYQLPDDIDRLPLNVKEIMSHFFINPSILPLGLKRLDLNMIYNFEGNLDLNVALLPRSLKVLKLSEKYTYFNSNIAIEMLPPKLLEIKFVLFENSQPDNIAQLPTNLKIAEISLCWLKNIKHLKSIHTLKLHTDITEEGDDVLNLDTKDIPRGVTHLTIISNSRYQAISEETLPANLKYLKLIGHFQLQKDSFTVLSRSITIDLSCAKFKATIMHIPSVNNTLSFPDNVVNLSLKCEYHPFELLSLPNKLEYLDLGGAYGTVIRLPQTIKTLRLSNSRLELKKESIPASLETIDFKYHCKHESTSPYFKIVTSNTTGTANDTQQ